MSAEDLPGIHHVENRSSYTFINIEKMKTANVLHPEINFLILKSHYSMSYINFNTVNSSQFKQIH